MPQPLPRAFRRQIQSEDEAKIARIVREASDDEPEAAVGATAAGDWRRLRGIPSVGRGTGGTIVGTDPLRALLAKESRRRS